jgi:hypothetical protein
MLLRRAGQHAFLQVDTHIQQPEALQSRIKKSVAHSSDVLAECAHEIRYSMTNRASSKVSSSGHQCLKAVLISEHLLCSTLQILS